MAKQSDVNGNVSENTKADLQSSVWISWQTHPRTRNIARHIGIPLEEITTNNTGLLRYISLSIRTASFLSSRRPEVLIVQNPSMILTILALFLRPLFRYKLVVDAHNEAIEPYLHKEKAVLWLTSLCLKGADLTLVTNEPLAKVVRKAQGKAFVLPDKVPEYPGSSCNSGSDKLTVVLISTFALDEPIEEFLEAAKEFEGHITVYVTGRAEKLNAEIRAQAGSNVLFTGFLDEEKYWQLLAGADAIADLTRMDNCLVCGAYEGVSVGKPLILSDNEATRTYFTKGALYVDNTVSGIKKELSMLRERMHELQRQSIELRQELRESWNVDAERLVTALRALT
jgi:glycosyltransferase involved in cell wall biosynthesis